MQRTATIWMGLALTGLLAAPAAAITPGDRCEADKLKTAGKYAFCRMNAESRAIRKGEAPDYAKCDEKYAAKWSTVEGKAGGTCPVTADQAAVQTEATECTDGLTATIGGNPPAGCTGDLITCEDNLTTCGTDLTTCGVDLTTSNADLAVCGTDLTTCNAGLTTCGTNLTTCGADLTTCGTALTTCDTELTTCDTGLATCEGDLTTCDIERTTCGTELLACDADLTTCEADLATAELCGNGTIDAGEDCDLGTLNGATCITEGFAGGVLTCANGCTFDISSCWAARFVDNADGTITDNASGLMWEKKAGLNDVAVGANLHDADNRYSWSGYCSVNTSKYCQPNAAAAAACAAGAEGDPNGCAECTGGDGTCTVDVPAITTLWDWVAQLNAASFAGHTDWRAPGLRELLAIVDYLDTTFPAVSVAFQGASCGAACTDITNAACSCTQSDNYWSASTYVPGEAFIKAWGVGFDDGDVYADGKTGTLYVRAVRDGS